MGILNIVTDTPGQGGVNPRRVKIITTDNLATVTASGYLNNQVQQGYILQNTDVIDMIYSYSTTLGSGTYGEFTVNLNGGNVTLTASSGGGGGVILPVVSGNAAVFSGTSGQIADGGGAPILSTTVSGQTISSSTTAAIPNIANLTSTVVKSGAIMTSGNLSALSGTVVASTFNGGEIYGVKGKIELTGTATGTGRAAALYAELDIDSVDLSLALVSVIYGHMGTSAEIGGNSNLYGIVLENSTPAIPNAQIFLGGGADYLMELVDNSGLIGQTYFVNAGTAAGSAGDTTKCNASKVITVKVNGTNYFIPLFASNA